MPFRHWPAARRRSLLRRVAAALLLLVMPWLAACSHPAANTASTVSVANEGDGDGVRILLELADGALRQKQLLAPEGANAYEFYLSVLQLDPANATAREHLDATFAQAMDEVEQSINARSLDEAARELRLLREVDANNYTLSLLAGKLDAQRMIVVREDEARAEQMRTNAAAAASR